QFVAHLAEKQPRALEPSACCFLDRVESSCSLFSHVRSHFPPIDICDRTSHSRPPSAFALRATARRVACLFASPTLASARIRWLAEPKPRLRRSLRRGEGWQARRESNPQP